MFTVAATLRPQDVGTLEAAAEAMGASLEVLRKTLEDYNEADVKQTPGRMEENPRKNHRNSIFVSKHMGKPFFFHKKLCGCQ